MRALARKFDVNNRIVQAVFVVAFSFLVVVLLLRSPLLATISLLALLVMGWIIFYPEVGLFLLLLFMPLQRSVLGNFGLALSWFPGLALSIVFFIYIITNIGKIHLSEYLPEWSYLALWGYVALSLYIDASVRHGGAILVSPMAGGGVAHFRYNLQALLFFLSICFLVTSRHRLKVIVSSLWVVFIIVCIVALYDLCHTIIGGYSYLDVLYSYFYFSGVRGLPSVGRGFALGGLYRGWTGNAQLANFLVSAGFILFPVSYYQTKSPGKKISTTFLLLGMLLCFYYTRSMGNWIAFGGGLLLLLVLLAKRRAFAVSVLGVVLLISILIIYLLPSSVYLVPEPFRNKTISIVNFLFKGRYPETGSIWVRIDLIKAGWWMFLQNPLFGMGFATYGRYAPMAGYRGIYILASFNYAHNSYIEILAELGLIGMILFLAFLYFVIRNAVSNIREAKNGQLRYLQIGTLAAIFANLIFLADYETWMFNLNFWLPVALTLAIRNVIKEEQSGINGKN